MPRQLPLVLEPEGAPPASAVPAWRYIDTDHAGDICGCQEHPDPVGASIASSTRGNTISAGRDRRKGRITTMLCIVTALRTPMAHPSVLSKGKLATLISLRASPPQHQSLAHLDLHLRGQWKKSHHLLNQWSSPIFPVL